MHIFLIRHGETEHNVAGLLAGVSDSRLTNHGRNQTERLGQYLAAHRNLRFTRIFASDLQRAYMTAEQIQRHQAIQWSEERVPDVIRLPVLREQDFGSYELVPWASRRAQEAINPEDPSFRPQETAEAMAGRADVFINDHVIPLSASSPLAVEQDSLPECVAVVSHGLFLSALWKTLLTKFHTGTVVLGPNIEVLSYGRPLEFLPSWSNTGFLEITIHRNDGDSSTSQESLPPTATDNTSPFAGCRVTVHNVNGKDHLLDLRRARGGIGSSPYDAKQKSLDGFFKRPKDG
ncbi:uncharacterized protein PV06_07198 [Exophiala oligosperma]|uniref:Phosphoglycerate mutase n=2 Tax=Chaetothyriales TaxID=34395 RepID=A0A0D2ANY9_9EURO|nr:uncharacterized protein PV06_07198 [Exophiala oligosperma]KAJ9617876.1 hypothetical protein H2204_013345 [Knufia peltigerae]KIW41661.1 hypothetical protein PV06_07198 [Exophiala oligosperma]